MSTKAKHKMRSRRATRKNKDIFAGFKRFYPRWYMNAMFNVNGYGH